MFAIGLLREGSDEALRAPRYDAAFLRTLLQTAADQDYVTRMFEYAREMGQTMKESERPRSGGGRKSENS